MSQMRQVETQLRDMILGLELGPGERLTERWIEARFEASRTPIRAALLRLEAEGLICREGRGWTVSPINLGEIEQIGVYREALEIAALKLTCALEDRSHVEPIAAMLDSCDAETSREEWHRIGMDFHISWRGCPVTRFSAAACAMPCSAFHGRAGWRCATRRRSLAHGPNTAPFSTRCAKGMPTRRRR